MGRRMKEIEEAEELYDYEAMESEIDYADEELKQEEEEFIADQINAVTASLTSVEEKKPIVREQALAMIIKLLEDGSPYYNNHIFDNYAGFLDLFHQCLFLIEKGSSKEVSLAAYIIGFLALSTGHLPLDSASSILHKSLPLIYKHLKLPVVLDSTKTVSLLNCLAIIDFLFGGDYTQEEPAPAPVVIWRKVGLILGVRKGLALLAYGFSLTSPYQPPTFDIHHISYLFSVLDSNCESRVGAVCAQILALIFEIYDLPHEVRQKALIAVNCRLSSEQNMCQWNVLNEVAEFLEHGCLPISKRKKDKRKDEIYVQTSSWVDLIRLKFLTQFLGKKAFSEHIKKNKLLQNVLKVSSTDEAAEVRVSERMKDQKYIWLGKKSSLVQRKKLKVLDNKRRILNKQRTQNLEKSRIMKTANATA